MRPNRHWVFAVVLLLGFVYLFLGIFQTLNYYDEGLAVLRAQQVADGQVPYRDFWAPYAPGQLYTLAAVFRVFGFAILVERIWDTLVRFGICIVVLLIGRKLGVGGAVYWPFLITLLFLAWCGAYGSNVFPAMLWSLLAALLLLYSFSEEGSHFPFLGGLATGAATLYRHDFGVYTFLSAAAALWILSLEDLSLAPQNRAKLVQRLKTLFLYVAGTGVLVVPVLLYFLLVVPLHELWADFVVFPGIQLRFRALPLPPLLPSPSYLLNSALLLNPWFLFCGPLTLYLISWIGLVRSFRSAPRDPEGTGRRFGHVVLTVLGSLLFIYASMRADLMHCMPTATTASILLPMLLADWVAAKRRAWSRVLVTLCLLVLTVPCIAIPIELWHIHLSDCAPWRTLTSSLPRARYFRVDADVEDAVQFIRQNVPRDQTIFVGNSQHQRVFSNDVLFYFLAERRAGTKFYDFIPGVITTAPVQQEMIRDLEQNHVSHVVLVSDYGHHRTSTGVPVDRGATLLDDFIRREYRQVQTFGRYSVWEKNQDSP